MHYKMPPKIMLGFYQLTTMTAKAPHLSSNISMKKHYIQSIKPVYFICFSGSRLRSLVGE